MVSYFNSFMSQEVADKARFGTEHFKYGAYSQLHDICCTHDQAIGLALCNYNSYYTYSYI